MSNAVGPIAAHRNEMLQQMTPALRDVAVQMQTELTAGTRKAVQHFHRIGILVDSVLSDQTNHYGAKAIEKLEAFLNIKSATLRDYRSFARAFPEAAYVADMQNRPTLNGLPLSVMHWVYASRLEDARQQKIVLEKAIREGLTSNQLLEYISGTQEHSGGHSNAGRNPKPPTTPVAGVTKIGKLAAKLDNYIKEVADEHIFDPLAHLSADVVTPALGDTLKESRDRLAAVIDSAQEAMRQLDTSLERVSRIVVAAQPADVPNDNIDEEREQQNPVDVPAEPKKRGRPAKKTPTT